MFKSILLTVILMCCPLAQAQIYKWTDEKGNIHYSAIPPVTGSYETLQKSPPSSPGPDGTSSTAANPNAASSDTTMEDLQKKLNAADKAREETEQQEKEKQEEADAQARRTANCEQAKTNLQALESDKVVLRVDAQGNKTRLEGAQREETMKQARKDIDYFCTP